MDHLRLDEGLDNGSYWYGRLCAARNTDELDQTCLDIGYDKWENLPYTRDSVVMDRLRSRAADRYRELRGK